MERKIRSILLIFLGVKLRSEFRLGFVGEGEVNIEEEYMNSLFLGD